MNLTVGNIVWDGADGQSGLPAIVTVRWTEDFPPDEAPEGFVEEAISEHLTRTYGWCVSDFDWKVA